VKARLLSVDRAARGPLSDCLDLVPLDPDACPDCTGPMVPHSVAQPALLRHGGYGETRQTHVLVCADPACSRTRTVAVSSVRPERRG
jgi:hypothetical protein